MFLADRLAGLARARVALVPAVREFALILRRDRSRETLESVASDLERGAKLSEALTRQAENFPPLLVALVNAGEKNDQLALALEAWSRLARIELRLCRMVSSYRLFSTVFLLLFLALICGILFWADMSLVKGVGALFFDLTEGKMQLPPLTYMALFLADYVLPWVLPVTGGAAILLVLGVLAVALLSRLGTLMGMRMMLSARSKITHHFALAHWCQLVSSLVQLGVPLTDTLALAQRLSPRSVLQRATRKVAEEIRQGRQFSGALAIRSVFPVSLVEAIQRGEERNTLAEELQQAAEIFCSRAESSERLAEAGQPKMVNLVVGIVVALVCLIGLCVLALFLPLISVISSMMGY